MNYLYKGKDDKKPRQRTLDANALFDYLAGNPNGIRLAGMMSHFKWNRAKATEAIRSLRLILGDGDSINLVADPTEHMGQWLYRLVGNYEDARWYVNNRIGDLEARLDTQVGIAQSLETATDGRTVEGRKARMIRSTLSHLVEQLRLLDSSLDS
jgi:hypothetical protein